MLLHPRLGHVSTLRLERHMNRPGHATTFWGWDIAGTSKYICVVTQQHYTIASVNRGAQRHHMAAQDMGGVQINMPM